MQILQTHPARNLSRRRVLGTLGDIGILGAWAAHVLRVPLVASWHFIGYGRIPEKWRRRRE